AERAAEEAGTTTKVIMSWLKEIDENISQLNSEWEEGTSKDSDEADESAKAVIGIQDSDIDQGTASVSASTSAISAASIARLSVSSYDRNSLKSEERKSDEKSDSLEQAESRKNQEYQGHQNPQKPQKGETCYNDKNNSYGEAKSMKTKSVKSKTGSKTKSQASAVVSPLYKDTRLKKVKIDQLVPFDKHPFRVPDKDSPEMQKLISSIEKEGLLNPPIVRKMNASGNTPDISDAQENADVASGVAENVADASNTSDEIYQIVCGHRRIEACKVLGYKDVLVRVVAFANDDDATLAMISSNVQREKIEFPEKVRACSLMYEAKKHQGVARSEEGSLTRAYVGKIWNVSSTTIERFLKLATLSDGLLDLIGRKKITSIVGMEIAEMSQNMQGLMESVLFENKDLKPRLQQAQEIRARGEMTREEVIALLQQEEKPAPKKFAIRFSSDEMRKILPDEENPTEERVKAFIFERLGISL
ncbi:MAG: ParB N-terminal domain-containing protein, partial [Synergistaceae bacterium]|nr:ParB N-terminal domain-containing protein [Synergistaceae bacterium]